MSDGRIRALRDGAILAGLLFLGLVLLFMLQRGERSGYDAFAYWSVDRPDVYAIPHGGEAAFVYSPPAALVADTFSLLPWPVFLVLWTALLAACVVWLGGSPLWIAAAFAFPATAVELYFGNIHLLLAVAVVLGFSHPWAWSFVLLTKPTAGVGLLWFAVRREWRSLGTALGVTAALVLVSWLVAPGLWTDYVGWMLATPVDDGTRPMVMLPLPLWLRVALGAALVAWGARTDRRWTVPIGAMVAMPVVWYISAVLLLALIPEFRRKARTDTTREVPAPRAGPLPSLAATGDPASPPA
jgi:hypothetical protein